MTDPIPLHDIGEGYYATDSHGFVCVRRGPDDVLTVWGLSRWDHTGKPSTWDYRAYGQPLDFTLRSFPDSRWWPSVDVRPEALADLVRRAEQRADLVAAAHDWTTCLCPQCQRIATLTDQCDSVYAERDRLRGEYGAARTLYRDLADECARLRAEVEAAEERCEETHFLLRAERDAVRDAREERDAALRERDASRHALTEAGIVAERESMALAMRRLTEERDSARADLVLSRGALAACIAERDGLSADLASARAERDAIRAYMTRGLDSGLSMSEGVALLDGLTDADMAIVDRWVEAMSIDRRERDALQTRLDSLRAYADCVEAERDAVTRERDEAARLNHQYRDDFGRAMARNGPREAEIARLTGEVERLRAHVRTLGALADLTPEQLGRLLAIEPTPEQVARLVEGT